MSKIESRCGLLCSECDFREACNCGGCVETKGHPFHGECQVAKCCQDKGYTHCGECPNLPDQCGVEVCEKKDKKGITPCDGCEKTSCGKLHAYSYTDPDHGDNPPGKRVEQCRRWANEHGE